MAVTFTPTFSARINMNGGSALLVKGQITTTANDAVQASSLGFSQVLEFVGCITNSGDETFLGKVQGSAHTGPSNDLTLCPIDNAHASFPATSNWPSETYDVTFIAL